MENVENPSDYIEAVLSRVKADYLVKTYKIPSWSDATHFLEQLAARTGKLLKVGRVILHTIPFIAAYTIPLPCDSTSHTTPPYIIPHNTISLHPIPYQTTL